MSELAVPDLVEGEIPGISLFGSSDPEAILDRAVQVSGVLERVLRERELVLSIDTRQGPRDHVKVEGWTLLGAMLGLFPYTVWTRPLEGGWEARVEARTLDGRPVTAAEAECLRSESRWARAEDYAVRSMAQTRATSKALRLPLGFVMQLAGFDPTPAEEMPDVGSDAGSPRQRRTAPASDPDDPPARRAELNKLMAAYREHGIGDRDQYLRFASHVLERDVTTHTGMAGRDVRRILTALDSSEHTTVALLEQISTPFHDPVEETVGERTARLHLITLLEQRHLTGSQRLDLLSDLVMRRINAIDHLTLDELEHCVRVLEGDVMPGG